MARALRKRDDLRADDLLRLADACEILLHGAFKPSWLKQRIRAGQCESIQIAGQTLVTKQQVDDLCQRLSLEPVAQWRAARNHSTVYFIRCNEFVKIGYAEDVARRVSIMRGNSPYDLELLATMPGGLEKEEELHRRFRHLRHRGEWFRLEPDLIEFLRQEGVYLA